MCSHAKQQLDGPRLDGGAPHTVRLRYPRSWAVAVSPHASEAERRALDWLRERGVVHDARTSVAFERLSVAEYASWPFPTASLERAEIITKFLSLWIFYDDAIEEADDGQARAIHDAIRGLPASPPRGDHYLRCWWELGQRYGREMSRSWLERHANRFSDWVTAVAEERALAAAFRASGAHPSAARQLEARRRNIGMYPNVDFLEYQMGWELPAEVQADPLLQSMEHAAAEAVAIVNDVFGYSKDRGNRWCNLVACLLADGAPDVARAFERAAALHDERVSTLASCEGQLVRRYPHLPELARWMAGLRAVVYGFARWHSRAPRYRASHVVDGREIRIVIDEV